MFYGFYYALDGISGSVTVNFLIMAVLEVIRITDPVLILPQVPTGVVTAWSMGRFGRWNTLFLNLALILICSAVSLLKVELGATGWDLKRVALIVGSKWGTAAVFMIVYLYTNELPSTYPMVTPLLPSSYPTTSFPGNADLYSIQWTESLLYIRSDRCLCSPLCDFFPAWVNARRALTQDDVLARTC
eukprot:sb/3471315/